MPEQRVAVYEGGEVTGFGWLKMLAKMFRRPIPDGPPVLVRACLKCGYEVWTGGFPTRPFSVRYDENTELLEYSCPRCGYQDYGVCKDAKANPRKKKEEKSVD